jgi:anthranilate synthase component 2
VQKILLLDNYDSFTYNLRQLLAESRVKHTLTITYHDQILSEEVANFDKILLSPGAGLPHEAGKMPEIIERWADKKTFLGVCLGHQALAESFGGKLYALPTPMHGQRVSLNIQNFDTLFAGIRQGNKVGLYHSWAVEREIVSNTFTILAEANNTVMAMQHKTLPIWGVQFHPESMMTHAGLHLIRNWLQY